MRRTDAKQPARRDGEERPAEPVIDEVDVVEPVELAPVEVEAVESEAVEFEPVQLEGVTLFTIPRSKAFAGGDQDYVSELLNGMLETGNQVLRICRDKPLPFFGFLNQKPLRCSYDGIVRYLGHVIGVPPDKLAWGAEGVLRATAGDGIALMELIFGVEIGPRTSWVRFTRDLETRVFRQQRKA